VWYNKVRKEVITVTPADWKVYQKAMKSAREKAKEMPKKVKQPTRPSELFKKIIGS
jgi:hypothetical protein